MKQRKTSFVDIGEMLIGWERKTLERHEGG